LSMQLTLINCIILKKKRTKVRETLLPIIGRHKKSSTK
jgi:hypothetical protein